MSHPWAPARIDTPMAAHPAMASITVVMAVARCDPLSVRVSSFMVKPPSHARRPELEPAALLAVVPSGPGPRIAFKLRQVCFPEDVAHDLPGFLPVS